jgi:hypothetical protein
MSEVTVKFKSLGIPQIKTDHRSVLQMSKELQLSIAHLEQNNAQRIKEINRDKLNTLKILNERFHNDQARLLKATEKLEQQTAEKITRIQEREQLRRSQMAQRAALPGGGTQPIGGAGHLAQVAGFYRVGHALRAMQSLGVGTALGVAAVGAAILPVVAAFSMLKDATETVIGSFVSAIGQIGNARNLTQMIVEAASSQRLSAQIAANTTDGFSTRSILATINKLSANSEFTSEQVGAMAVAFKAKTGTFGDFAQLGGFATNLASVAGLSPEETGGILGQLRTQFPSLSIGQTKQAAMQLWSLGRSGAVELKDAQSITQALGFAGKINPDLIKGMASEMGFVQMAQRFTGGQNSDQAVTGVRRLQEEMLKTPQKFGFLGNYLTHTSKGEAVFKDFDKTMAYATLQAYRHPEATGFEARANKALYGIANAESANFTGNTQHDIKILEEAFQKFQDGTKVIDEFDGTLKDVQDTVAYKFKLTFNQVSVDLKGKFLPILEDIEKITPELINTFKALAYAGAEVGIGLAELGLALASLLNNTIFKMAVGTAETAAYADLEMRKVRISTENARMADLAGRLEGKNLSPEERDALTKSYLGYKDDRDKDETKAEKDKAFINSIKNLPDKIDNMISVVSPILTKLQDSIDKNTTATENNTPYDITVPTPASPDGK